MYIYTLKVKSRVYLLSLHFHESEICSLKH